MMLAAGTVMRVDPYDDKCCTAAKPNKAVPVVIVCFIICIVIGVQTYSYNVTLYWASAAIMVFVSLFVTWVMYRHQIRKADRMEDDDATRNNSADGSTVLVVVGDGGNGNQLVVTLPNSAHHEATSIRESAINANTPARSIATEDSHAYDWACSDFGSTSTLGMIHTHDSHTLHGTPPDYESVIRDIPMETPPPPYSDAMKGLPDPIPSPCHL